MKMIKTESRNSNVTQIVNNYKTNLKYFFLIGQMVLNSGRIINFPLAVDLF